MKAYISSPRHSHGRSLLPEQPGKKHHRENVSWSASTKDSILNHKPLVHAVETRGVRRADLVDLVPFRVVGKCIGRVGRVGGPKVIAVSVWAKARVHRERSCNDMVNVQPWVGAFSTHVPHLFLRGMRVAGHLGLDVGLW